MTTMKSNRKRGLGAIAAVSALALLAMPGLASAHGGRGQAGMALQPAHMTQGQGGAWSGQPCPMGAAYQGMMGHGMNQGMMGPGTGQGMMGQGMMAPGPGGQSLMGPGMMGPGYGWDRGHGMRVTPRVDLSIDDVRHFFADRLAMHGNKRLKVGEIKVADDDSIVADIVTLDDSLVQRFTVDRHSGRVQRTE